MARKRILLSWGPHQIVLILVIFHFVASSSQSDSEALRKFKASLRNADALSSWDNGEKSCEGDKEIWNGVLCDNGTVWGLKLENMGLGGVIDVDSLGEMQDLRALSFMNNNFDGPLPTFSKLGPLKSIYLSNNKFSGEISPGTFSGMLSLKKIYLANNSFSGPIPPTLTALPRLMELSLEDNGFEGGIPAFTKDRLKIFNVSNNHLLGEIPNNLSHFDASAFSGNTALCGTPLELCSSSNQLSVGTIVIVAILVAAALTALVAVVIILRQRKQTPQQPEISGGRTTPGQQKATPADLDLIEQGQLAPGSASPARSDHSKKGEQSVKLIFLREDKGKFEMTDLLKASAEILGSGVLGSTYKAALNDGHVMVVKRFRHMNNVSREEFNEHMRRLGKLDHPNVLPVVAFYYRKEEKLLVTEFAENVSLAVHLHSNRSRGLPPPDWPTRLNIVKGVAKGLKYLYNELPSLTTPHGHLKSSNVLLDRAYNPLLTDYGLVPVVNQEHAQEHMISYKSPEHKKNGRITKKTDVWSLGILILEILTGRFPSNFLQQGKGSDTDLTTWVLSVMRDDSNMEVFDGDMDGTKNCEGAMMKLLKIGLSCCENDVEKRPDIKDIVEKIEEVKDKDIDDDFYSSYTSDPDKRSSRGLSDDFNVTFN